MGAEGVLLFCLRLCLDFCWRTNAVCSARAEKHNNQQPSGGTTQAKTTAQRAQLKKKAKEYGGTKGRLSEYMFHIFKIPFCVKCIFHQIASLNF